MTGRDIIIKFCEEYKGNFNEIEYLENLKLLFKFLNEDDEIKCSWLGCPTSYGLNEYIEAEELCSMFTKDFEFGKFNYDESVQSCINCWKFCIDKKFDKNEK